MEQKVNLTLEDVFLEQIIYSDSIRHSNSTWVKVKVKLKDKDLKINYVWAHSYDYKTINKISLLHQSMLNGIELNSFTTYLNIWPSKSFKGIPDYDNTYKWYLVDIESCNKKGK